jgi:hypothetical protein
MTAIPSPQHWLKQGASAAGALLTIRAYTRINIPRKSEEYAMNPPVAARASASTPSLHDRLKDPSLLRDRCYIDGAWVGTPSRPSPIRSMAWNWPRCRR